MLRLRALIFVIIFCSFTSYAPTQTSQAAGPGNCKTYYWLQQLSPDVLSFLATQSPISSRSAFAPAGYPKLRDWDFPSKVTAWKDRPSAGELAKQWEELSKKWPASRAGRAAFRPYGLAPLSANHWRDLQKWFFKEGPKEIPGLCSDPSKTNYVIEVGIISDRADASGVNNATSRNEYQQYSGAREQDRSYGPNAAVESPTAHVSTPQELAGMESGSAAGTYTCVYLFRSAGMAHQSTPEYFYCKSSGEVPKSAVTTMLKFLAKE